MKEFDPQDTEQVEEFCALFSSTDSLHETEEEIEDYISNHRLLEMMTLKGVLAPLKGEPGKAQYEPK